MSNGRDLPEAIADAARLFVDDAIQSLTAAQLDRLALSGPANEFAQEWGNRPSYERLAMVLTHDDAIRSLLKPPDRDAPALYSFFVGTTLWARQVPAAILASALFDLMIVGEPRNPESVLSGVLQNMERLRRIAAGKEIDCRWVAGLVGVRLDRELRHETALGTLRGVEPPWESLQIWARYPPQALVSGKLTMRVKVVQPDEQGTVTGDMRGHQEALDTVRLIRLAIVLGQSEAEALRPQMTVMTAGAPHLGWMANLTESKLSSNDESPGRELTIGELAEVRRWCQLFAERYTPTVGVAVERTLSAATERSQPADVLIDSVIAWENLVGTESETTFRVTAALACLLESDPSRRRDRMRHLQAIYRARSRVVHGEPLDYVDIERNAQAALTVAKDAIGQIFGTHPWLLSLRSSRERADALLLGDPRLASSESTSS